MSPTILGLYMEHHLCSVFIMIEVSSRRIESTHFNSDYSQMMPAVVQQYEQLYGPVFVNWRGHAENRRRNDLFFGNQLHCSL